MPRNPQKCKFCGEENLHWERKDGRFQLHKDSDNSLHSLTCTGQIKSGPKDERAEVPVKPGAPIPDAAAELWKIVRPAALADTELAGNKPITHEIVIHRDDEEPKIIPDAHPQLAELLDVIASGVNAMLVGPAGSGKTHAAEMAAEHLGVAYYPTSIGPQTSKSDLLGYMDATGRYVRTNLREAFEHGGLNFMDELDAGNPGALTCINAAIENRFAGFADGTIKRHAGMINVCAANTYGTGADRQYVGRNQLDAATLNRFAVINWDYDTALESRMGASFPGWVKFIHALRKAREKTKIKTVISTRAIIMGVKLLSRGIEEARVKDMIVFNGISRDDREKLLANL